jgi:ParB family chromosome partitioning protein
MARPHRQPHRERAARSHAPADQFEAFAALVAEGRPIEDIAADFGVTPLVVQRRLKLANVSPRLMADYRADAVTLDQLMALPSPTTTPRRKPRSTMRRMAAQPVQAARAPDRARNRRLPASAGALRRAGHLRQAGGGIRRDLFAEGDAGVYLTDAALLERWRKTSWQASPRTCAPRAGHGWMPRRI